MTNGLWVAEEDVREVVAEEDGSGGAGGVGTGWEGTAVRSAMEGIQKVLLRRFVDQNHAYTHARRDIARVQCC